MKFTDRIEINRHKVIEKKGMAFADVLSGEDKETVLSIVNKSKEFLSETGDVRNVVYNPTDKEKGSFSSAIKRYVRIDFIIPAQKRIKEISDALSDIDGICYECSKNEKSWIYGEYDLCFECQDKWNMRNSIWWAQYNRRAYIDYTFIDACESTNFSDELVGNWFLLVRKMKEDKKSKHIDRALKDFIRDELVKEFREQNKQLIKKYGL